MEHIVLIELIDNKEIVLATIRHVEAIKRAEIKINEYLKEGKVVYYKKIEGNGRTFEV